MKPRALGLDIGGANLKSAHTDGTARSRPFPVWKHLDRLAEELSQILTEAPPFDVLAVTMTAELCDCFETKQVGVNAILDAVEAAAGPQPVLVWQNHEEFVSPEIARQHYLRTASANWLALARLAVRYCGSHPGILLDIGSTTTDIIPINERPASRYFRTDLERLANHELVYSGVVRTPICAVLPSVTIRGASFSPAAEFFATTQDAYLLLEKIGEDPADCQTADGRPATRKYAHARMARMVCADADLLSYDEAVELAEQVRQAQIAQLTHSLYSILRRSAAPPRTAILAGAGEFLAREVIARSEWRPMKLASLAAQLGSHISSAACAYAVAVLAAERS